MTFNTLPPATIQDSETEFMAAVLVLILVYRSPIVELTEICERYFGMSHREANTAAVRHQLPVPAFKLTDSRRAPFLVSCFDLAKALEQKQRAGLPALGGQ